jgi:hypothetical protein
VLHQLIQQLMEPLATRFGLVAQCRRALHPGACGSKLAFTVGNQLLDAAGRGFQMELQR